MRNDSISEKGKKRGSAEEGRRGGRKRKIGTRKAEMREKTMGRRKEEGRKLEVLKRGGVEGKEDKGKRTRGREKRKETGDTAEGGERAGKRIKKIK